VPSWHRPPEGANLATLAGMGSPDPLADLRAAVAAQEWQAAYDAGAPVSTDAPEVAADRADMFADAAWWLGRLDDCIEARERAYRLYEELGDAERAGQCAVWLYEHHLFVVKPTIAGAWLRRARRALETEHESTAYGALLLREAESAHGGGELPRAGELADDVIALARRLKSADLEAEGLQTKGRVLIDSGDVADGMGHLDEAMLFAVEGRLRPYSTGKVYCSLISACEELGDLDRAAEWTEATMTWAAQAPFAIFPGICRVHRAVVLKRGGALADAEREAMLAGEELLRTHRPNSAAAYAEVGDIRRRLGDLDRAEEAFDRAQELCGRACGERAVLLLAQGRVTPAVTTAAECMRATNAESLARARVLPIYVQVLIASGDAVAAAEAVDELETIAAKFGTPFLRATHASTRGRWQLAVGDAGAVPTLQQAVDAWHALDVPYEVATSRTLLGQALRLSGDEAGAAEAFARAAEQFDAIGARLDAQQVYGSAKTALPAGLTEREVEVLRLIASGLTNNDMAGQLHLSVKTVSRHVSNIFTKIGATSRAAATAFAFEHDLVRRG
jgi:DNA-binding CsgD family transcriptional regulator